MLCNEHIITLHMWISVAPSVGKRNCSWIRCRMLLAVQDTSYFSWASTYHSLSGRHCYNTLCLISLFQAVWEVWDEELSACKSSLIVTIIIIMIIIKLEITYDFITLPVFVFSFFITLSFQDSDLKVESCLLIWCPEANHWVPLYCVFLCNEIIFLNLYPIQSWLTSSFQSANWCWGTHNASEWNTIEE